MDLTTAPAKTTKTRSDLAAVATHSPNSRIDLGESRTDRLAGRADLTES